MTEPRKHTALTEARAPFDPGDPFDAMANEFRIQVTNMVLRAQKAAIYKGLGPQKQLECFLAGALSGIIGVCFASIEPDGRDYIMEYLEECLPVAREMAESIMDQDGRAALAKAQQEG